MNEWYKQAAKTPGAVVKAALEQMKRNEGK